MNYTKNYHLPQWEEADRVLRTDFNQMCVDMEAGLDKTAADAAKAVKKAETSAATATAKAQSTADKAVADAAQAAADAARAQATADAAYCPTNLPYKIGTYMGTAAEQTVYVGFRPGFLIVSNPEGDLTDIYFLAAGQGVSSEWVEFTSTGFKVSKNNKNYQNVTCAPAINLNKRQYVYIAFR